MGGEVAVQEPQARLWPEGCMAAVASGADALGHRTGGRMRSRRCSCRPGAPGGLAQPAPWRAPGTRTAGLIQAGIARILREVGRSAFIAAIWEKIDAAASSAGGSSGRSPTKPRKPPNAAIIVPVTWRQSGATKKKCRLETTVSFIKYRAKPTFAGFRRSANQDRASNRLATEIRADRKGASNTQ